MQRRKILLLGGSMNQTTMMHQISRHLPEHECVFTQIYSDGVLDHLRRHGYLEFTVLGNQFRKQTEEYCREHNLRTPREGEKDFDLVITCSDLVIQKGMRDKPYVLVQEGMTDPENLLYYLVKYLRLPRWMASTSTTGLSHAYDMFCVASEGYKEHFIKKGVDPEKLVVTGIPNFDNVAQHLNNSFEHKGYVLVATSDTRETFKIDSRKKFLRKAKAIAGDRQIIVKLHPNENVERNTAEIKEVMPNALVYSRGNTNEMIANCDELITQYSSVVYVGLALGKKCHSYFDMDELKRMTPEQNGGKSAGNIAAKCREVLQRQTSKKPDMSYA